MTWFRTFCVPSSHNAMEYSFPELCRLPDRFSVGTETKLHIVVVLALIARAYCSIIRSDAVKINVKVVHACYLGVQVTYLEVCGMQPA